MSRPAVLESHGPPISERAFAIAPCKCFPADLKRRFVEPPLGEDDLGTAAFDGKKWSNPHHRGGHAAGHFIKWHTIANQAARVLQDVRRIREHSLVPASIPIYGYVYDVHTGRLDEVKDATEAGRAAS